MKNCYLSILITRTKHFFRDLTKNEASEKYYYNASFRYDHVMYARYNTVDTQIY
jgi:hypothetical protein